MTTTNSIPWTAHQELHQDLDISVIFVKNDMLIKEGELQIHNFIKPIGTQKTQIRPLTNALTP